MPTQVIRSTLATHDLLPDKQHTYLVIESALMMLFTTCYFCKSLTTNVRKAVIGSFLRITQWCNICQRRRVWESQPHIGSKPAGNVLISAAILYAGALPMKALRVFSILNCATITCKTFYRHQRQFLQPAVKLIWERNQQAIFAMLKEGKSSLVVGGDGRADSPGHSAKYGTYSLIELTHNKVIDFKLVQVSTR